MDLRKSTLNHLAEVSLSLSKHVISAHAKDANVVFSPLSIHVLLGMIAAGSNGPTRDQLLGFLKSESIEELNSLSSHLVTRVFADGEPLRGPHLSLANGVWADEVVKEVNTWAEKETNGLIKDLLSSGSVEATTILIFANALYFKGAWKDIFMEYLTSDGEFFLVNGSSIHVPFMTGTKMQYARAFDGFKVLRREYKQGGDYSRRFSMYFFLPDAKDGLPALLEKVCSEPGFIEAHKPDRLVLLGKFRVPKFKIDFQFEVSDVLKGLGVMVGSSIDGESLFVSGMFQKAFIEVNEKGTEAAAVSHVRGGGYYEVELDFVADHPFLFVIREDVSAVVLFIGQLLNPLA
ncbi:hypothetical protein MIMGU_mgv1a023989mg [Erythranthe guttata]|uniref:Serpin domain-containing protein n=1 Tax=Erythranthe guttata TaxID=4155 RepID=A0A022Q9J8_ERYGU|nr:hypothetical protein MIMGU_mgv1a023989mg [Erythranthe guttata]